MAVSSTMNQQDNHHHHNDDKGDDEHEHDMVMPGFRFHPTEEELVEFYLRRKVEGKRFNLELITFLDLYRYDPWELPALAAIGEKEWFFYVPRDRKYRNGDRPNRVTTSGYWKATGADRMIRTENFRPIGLKKTLVFYSGKAPKGIRTSWIMNEYRLPHHETERLQKAEISLCRVYKRAGVEDHPSLPRSLPTRASSSSSKSDKNDLQDHATHNAIQTDIDHKIEETNRINSTSNDIGTAPGLSNSNSNYNIIALAPISSTLSPPNCTTIYTGGSSSFAPMPNAIDDLHRLISYQQVSVNQPQLYHNNHPNYNHPSQFSTTVQPVPQSQSLALSMLPGSVQAGFPDRMWEWNSITEAASKDYGSAFK